MLLVCCSLVMLSVMLLKVCCLRKSYSQNTLNANIKWVYLKRAQFQVSCFTSPSSIPNSDLAPLSPLLLNTIQHSTLHNSRRTAAADCVVCVADLVVPANHEWLLVCVSVPSLLGRDCIWTAAKSSVRKSKSSMSLYPAPRCPIKSVALHRCCTATSRKSSLTGKDNILWLWVRLTLCFVWLPVLCYVSLWVSPNMSQTWGVDMRTHHSYRPQVPSRCHGNVTKPL